MPWLMTQFADGVGGEEDARKAKTCSRSFFQGVARKCCLVPFCSERQRTESMSDSDPC
jgi:hypothetical protein